jgi:hypothetical protein
MTARPAGPPVRRWYRNRTPTPGARQGPGTGVGQKAWSRRARVRRGTGVARVANHSRSDGPRRNRSVGPPRRCRKFTCSIAFEYANQQRDGGLCLGRMGSIPRTVVRIDICVGPSPARYCPRSASFRGSTAPSTGWPSFDIGRSRLDLFAIVPCPDGAARSAGALGGETVPPRGGTLGPGAPSLPAPSGVGVSPPPGLGAGATGVVPSRTRTL